VGPFTAKYLKVWEAKSKLQDINNKYCGEAVESFPISISIRKVIQQMSD
jgi:hypothetical protein